MDKYNYYDVLYEDVENAIDDYIEGGINSTDIEDFKNEIYDACFIDDSVTGNGSGSYTFSAYEAEENIAHNLDLAMEAADDFGFEIGDVLKNGGAERIDVIIRCYLLSQVIDDVFEKDKEDLKFLFEENELSIE